MNPDGPAGACVEAVLDGQIVLFLAEFVLGEIREIPDKPTPARAGVTIGKANELVQNLLLKAEFISSFPRLFIHPIDQDDSDYVNLALAVEAKLIVSRDRHLLNLNNPAKAWSEDFRRRFPQLQIISPEAMLLELRQ